MKTFALAGTARNDFGKKASKEIRKSGLIPAIIYGGSEKEQHFTVKAEDVRKLIYTPEIYLVELTIDKKKHTAIIQDLQFHPVKDTLLHIDFLQVYPDKAIIIEVPVKLEGLAEGVKQGGKLSLEMRKLRVKALYKNVPEYIPVDVTKLDLGKTIQVGELHFDNMELMNAKNAVVSAVKLTRAARGLQAKSDK